MAVTVRELITRQYLKTTPTVSYTNNAAVGSGSGVRIDKCVVSNPQTTAYTFSAYVIPSGGSGDNSNLVIKARTVQPGSADGCPELVNMVLGPGSVLALTADTSDKMNCGVSGTAFG